MRIQSIRVVKLLIVDVHFNIGKNWMQNVVYMNNEWNWSLLRRCLLLFRFCLFFVLFFYLVAIVSFVTTTPVSVTQPSTSVSIQRNSSNPFENQTLCSFHQVRYQDRFLVHGTTRHRQLLGLSLQEFQKLPQKFGTKNYTTWIMRNVAENVSLRPTKLFCRCCWNDSARTLFRATTTQLFSQSLSSHTLCSCLELSLLSKVLDSIILTFLKVSCQ